MNTPQWIKYDGSDEQIEEIDSGDNDILFRLENGKVMFEREVNGYWWKPFVGVTDYLICQPHPYADLIDIWRLSGCPVRYKHKHIAASGECNEFHLPFSYPDIYEYSLTPFED